MYIYSPRSFYLTYFPFSFPLTSCLPSFTFFYFPEWWADFLSEWGLVSSTSLSHFFSFSCSISLLSRVALGWGRAHSPLPFCSPTCSTCPVLWPPLIVLWPGMVDSRPYSSRVVDSYSGPWHGELPCGSRHQDMNEWCISESLEKTSE